MNAKSKNNNNSLVLDESQSTALNGHNISGTPSNLCRDPVSASTQFATALLPAAPLATVEISAAQWHLHDQVLELLMFAHVLAHGSLCDD